VPAHVIIVGAGAGGLAVAAALGQRGVGYELLERADSIGASWRSRYASLHLHTARSLSGLPGAPISRHYERWVSKDHLVDYLEKYARRFNIEPEFGVEVVKLDLDEEGWQVVTAAGTRHARAIVLATGYTSTPHVPNWPGLDTYTGEFRHSSDYREPSPYRGRQVLVIGSGNSAAEIAVELIDVAAKVDLSVRTPPNIVRRDTLGIPSQLIGIGLRRVPVPLLNPLSSVLRRLTVPDLRAWGLPAPPGGFTQFVRSGTVPILDHGFVRAVRQSEIRIVPTVSSIDGSEVVLVDGRVLQPNVIIAATGFRPNLAPLVGHLGVLDESGQPRVHGAETLPHAPGLYFVGISVVLSGQLWEIGREARAVARHVATVG
jgi:putative flavoprotein involved in K+ transport